MKKHICFFYLTIIFATAEKHDKKIDISDIDTSMTKPMIINGVQSKPGQFPWQVGIYGIAYESRFCGGALISNQWVLTAGHCIVNVQKFYVILGATQSIQNDQNKVSMGVSKFYYHPEYNRPYHLNNDVAVLQLAQPVRFSWNIKPIRLPKYGERLQDNTYVWVSGWGKTNDTNGMNNELNYVDLITISNEECRRTYLPSLVPDTVFCCRGENRKSTCQGDSGGPVIQNYNDDWICVGVVSFGSEFGCERGQPVGFTRTESYLNFIYSSTGLQQS